MINTYLGVAVHVLQLLVCCEIPRKNYATTVEMIEMWPGQNDKHLYWLKFELIDFVSGTLDEIRLAPASVTKLYFDGICCCLDIPSLFGERSRTRAREIHSPRGFGIYMIKES